MKTTNGTCKSLHKHPVRRGSLTREINERLLAKRAAAGEHIQFDLQAFADEIYCINLDRRQDRWARMQARLAEIGLTRVTRWSAADGRSAEVQCIWQNDSGINHERIKSPAVLGCLLSHLAVLEDAYAKGHRRILVLEDDAVFHRDFKQQLNRLWKLPPWKLLYLGSTQLDWSGVTDSPAGEGHYTASMTLGTNGLVIDRSLFGEIIESMRKYREPADNAIAESVQKTRPNECLVLWPPLLIQELFQSDLRTDAAYRGIADKCRWPLELYGMASEPVKTAAEQITKQAKAASINDVTFCVTCFDRPQHLARLLESIRRFYPQAKILVADNGREAPVVPAGVELIRLTYDCGVSAARNELAKRVKTRYLLILEEDFVFTPETKIEKLLDVLESDRSVGVAGASLYVDGVLSDYAVTISEFGREIELYPASSSFKATAAGTAYRHVDMVFLFCLMRRETAVDHRWDERLVIGGEHLAYFLEMKHAGIWRTAHVPSVRAIHDMGGRSEHYTASRGRAAHYIKRFKRLYGYEKVLRAPGVDYRKREMDRPNLVVLGVGHSGTTVLTRMLVDLGWNACDADQEYCESVSVREQVNRPHVERRECFNLQRAREVLAVLPQPWVIKDPRFVKCLNMWLPAFSELENPPELLWITKDIEAVKESYRRRHELVRASGEPGSFGCTVERLFELAEQQYHDWPWRKLQISYENLATACARFSPRK